jgi:hypothetical protein
MNSPPRNPFSGLSATLSPPSRSLWRPRPKPSAKPISTKSAAAPFAKWNVARRDPTRLPFAASGFTAAVLTAAIPGAIGICAWVVANRSVIMTPTKKPRPKRGNAAARNHLFSARACVAPGPAPESGALWTPYRSRPDRCEPYPASGRETLTNLVQPRLARVRSIPLEPSEGDHPAWLITGAPATCVIAFFWVLTA